MARPSLPHRREVLVSGLKVESPTCKHLISQRDTSVNSHFYKKEACCGADLSCSVSRALARTLGSADCTPADRPVCKASWDTRPPSICFRQGRRWGWSHCSGRCNTSRPAPWSACLTPPPRGRCARWAWRRGWSTRRCPGRTPRWTGSPATRRKPAGSRTRLRTRTASRCAKSSYGSNGRSSFWICSPSSWRGCRAAADLGRRVSCVRLTRLSSLLLPRLPPPARDRTRTPVWRWRRRWCRRWCTVYRSGPFPRGRTCLQDTGPRTPSGPLWCRSALWSRRSRPACGPLRRK